MLRSACDLSLRPSPPPENVPFEAVVPPVKPRRLYHGYDLIAPVSRGKMGAGPRPAAAWRRSVFQSGADAISSVNFFRSMLPPETTQTIGPLPALPVSAAASGRAPAPSAMTRAFSA